MAEIYLASAVGAEGFAKDVVIKVVRSFLASDPQFVQMFIAEARLASRLNHANVVQIFDFGKHEETYYLAMEFVHGASLWELRKRCREFGVPLPPTLAAEIGAQVARGLQYAHALSEGGQRMGVVHRDVTPHNVLLSFDGAVKLTDFGIAKATTSQTAPGMLKGKFAYMSPEQARGERVDARTDVFALGIVLWELLTGGRLFDGDSDVAVLRAVQESFIAPPSRLNPDVASDLSDIVMKALARRPEERFQSAFDLERALATWVLRNASTFEDTSVSAFVQHMFREEAEVQPLTVPVVAALGDDYGVGSTMFVDRSSAPAKPSRPTMTSTPVQRMPDRATPKPLKALEDSTIPPPRRTVKMPAVGAGTEQRPALNPAAISRRFDPLPAPEPSLVQGPKSAPLPDITAPHSDLHEQPRSEEVQLPPGAKPPLRVMGLTALALVGGVAAFVLWPRSPPEAVVPVPAVTLVKDAATELVAVGVPETAAVLDASEEETAGVDAGPPAEARSPTPDAGPAAGVAVAPTAGGPVAKSQPVKVYGTLTVKAIPFAEVRIDGSGPVEVTGVKQFTLTARAHVVQLKRHMTGKTVTVTIKPNQDTALEFNAE